MSNQPKIDGVREKGCSPNNSSKLIRQTLLEKIGIGFGLFLVVGLLVVGGAVLGQLGQDHRMGGYDLYACIENNAQINDYPRHPAMIEKVQQECICFKEKGYNGTRILEEGCDYDIV